MFRSGIRVQTKRKHEPTVYGVIIGHRKEGRSNNWRIRLDNGEEREYNSKSIEVALNTKADHSTKRSRSDAAVCEDADGLEEANCTSDSDENENFDVDIDG